MSKKNKEAVEQKDKEQAQPKEPYSPSKSETQSLLLRSENLGNKNREIREQLEEEKAEARALGLETLAKAMDRAKMGGVTTTVCTLIGISTLGLWVGTPTQQEQTIERKTHTTREKC